MDSKALPFALLFFHLGECHHPVGEFIGGVVASPAFLADDGGLNSHHPPSLFSISHSKEWALVFVNSGFWSVGIFFAIQIEVALWFLYKVAFAKNVAHGDNSEQFAFDDGSAANPGLRK
jgi:hypothetical protein